MKKLLTLLTMLCVTTVMSAATNYDLWIKGTRVTSSNASDILGTKAASYNASTKTLTLNQTYIESSTDEVITSKIEGLTIYVSGTVYLRSTNKDKNTVSLSGTTTITGTTQSSLTVTRYDAAGTVGFQPIRANCNLEINTIKIRVSNLNGGAAIRPLYTPDDSTPSNYTLTVKNADATFAAGGTYYPIYGFKNVSLTGCSLNPMTYYKTDAKSYYVADNSGNGVTGKDIVIKNRVYGSFGEVFISDANASNIKPKDMTKGTVKLYNFSNGAGKYIYLEDVAFSSSTYQGLYISAEEPCHFEVVVKGDNLIKSSSPFYVAPDTPGSVYVKASSSASSTPYLYLEALGAEPAMNVYCPDLNVNNINLYVSSNGGGGINGYQGYDNVDHTLRFNNAYASIKDNSTTPRGAIVNFKSVSYTDCYHFNQTCDVWNNKAYYTPQGKKTDFVSVRPGYGICINERDVTNANRNDVLGDGKVSYNPYTKTLNINSMNYKSISSPLFVFTPITINLAGANTLTTTSYVAALNLFANTTITGSNGATLAANNEIDYEGHAGIQVTQSALTIKDCEVSVYSPNGYGVKGQWAIKSTTQPGTSTLALNNASLVVNNSTKYNSIDNFKNLTLTDCCYERPTTATFDSELGYVKNGTASVKGNLEIRKGYGIIVGGTRVTKDNASNIKTGISYDAASNTLKFNNGKVSTDTYGILAYKDLNLYVSGTANTITSNKNHAILAYGDLNITGPGKSMSSMALTANGQNCAGIYMNKSGNKFNVKNTTLSARATSASSYGIVGNKSAATIQDAEVTGYGTSASIYSFSSLSMIGVDIITPAGAVFTPGVGVTLNGATVAAKDVIIGVKEYDLSVGGTKITAANCADVFGDGTVKYDPSSNTLTLNNAIIATEGYGIDAETSDRLYINLIGTSSVNSRRSYALYHNNTNGITIQSSSNGKLRLNGSSVGSFQEFGNITIKNCEVDVNGMHGIEGGNYCTLNLENVKLSSKCNYGAFKNIDNILLNNCYVLEPEDAVFNSTMGGFVSGGTLCNTIYIKAGTSAIEGVTLDAHDNAPAYNLNGVQVDKSYKGIVIKNGHKYIQK